MISAANWSGRFLPDRSCNEYIEATATESHSCLLFSAEEMSMAPARTQASRGYIILQHDKTDAQLKKMVEALSHAPFGGMALRGSRNSVH